MVAAVYSVSLNKLVCWWVCPEVVRGLHLGVVQSARANWDNRGGKDDGEKKNREKKYIFN